MLSGFKRIWCEVPAMYSMRNSPGSRLFGSWPCGSWGLLCKGYCKDPERSGLESNPSGGLILRKLLILQNDRIEKNCKNAEPRYTAGTWNDRITVAEVLYDLDNRHARN